MSTTLLLADDSPTIGKILGMALQSESYEIRSVLTAEDALKELKANPPYFFLVDLTLPGKNGYEFARLIKSDSKMKSVRVLLLSSAFDPADEEQVKACGADGVIAKPFDPGELRGKLRSIRDAPVAFPSGAQVKGSLSGFDVKPEEAPPPSPSLPKESLSVSEEASPALDLDSLLTREAPAGGDADSILSGLLAGNEPAPLTEKEPAADPMTSPGIALGSPDLPPSAPDPSREADAILSFESTLPAEGNNPTMLLDLSGQDLSFEAPQEPVLDLSEGFSEGPAAPLDPGPPPAPAEAAPPPPPNSGAKGIAPLPSAPPRLPIAPETADPAPAEDEPLSANAQALAAFFEAEIDAQPKSSPGIPAAPAAPPPLGAPSAQDEEDNFDASLSSIEWASPKEESLNQWSSAPASAPKEPPAPEDWSDFSSPAGASEEDLPPPAPAKAEMPLPRAEKPAPLPERQKPARAASESSFAGASSGGSFLFDTGGSNFRFSEDYIQRITKSFTGHPEEKVPETDPAPLPHQPVFGTSSSDQPPSFGGGAWSEEDTRRIEALVKEEVQMVVREIAEKVAWEVIPELAENLIRKELDKVLKEMEEQA